jgi:hypothetical protein
LSEDKEKQMLLEILLALLLLGAMAATLLTFFIRGDQKPPKVQKPVNLDTDNPQRDIS